MTGLLFVSVQGTDPIMQVNITPEQGPTQVKAETGTFTYNDWELII